MDSLTRRELLTAIAAAGAVSQLSDLIQPAQAQETRPADPLTMRWLEGESPAKLTGVTWGVPWPRGQCWATHEFKLVSDSGERRAMQTWATAYWPDGSIKWTAHAIGADSSPAKSYRIELAPADAPSRAILLQQSETQIQIDTGAVVVRIPWSGEFLITAIERDGKAVATNGQLICMRQPTLGDGAAVHSYASRIESVTVESAGPVRAVVKITGRHAGTDESGHEARRWLPFVVRFYFYAGSDQIRMMHSFIFDGDEQKDFIRGLGVRFSVPMRDAMHDRHVRLSGTGAGLFAEAVRTTTGLRRDPGRTIREAQVKGQPTPPISEWASTVSNRLDLIPAWGDFTLTQSSADGFQIRKRTKDGHAWIPAGAGDRAAGVGYVGGISGGLALGMRDFWQRHPGQIDIRNAHTDRAELTLWMWSPDAPAMDLRFYHDGMGMDSHPKELEGLNITYEDYEKGFGTPVGIARTTEFSLWPVSATPANDAMAEFAGSVATPPLLVCDPQRYLDCRVFGGLWSLPDRSTPTKAKIDDILKSSVDHYRREVEQRRWYGFWDYGDVMHSYDSDRHMWRYDVGGYAWANSELSPDLWLWYSFLRDGRAETFRLAEAMTRHTGEVDVYHLGRFKGLGSRHNVQHWGCSAKQLRISTAIYRRIFYYLTADERVGDLMRELVDADQTFLTLDPIRKIRQGQYTPQPHALAVGFGTDWGSLAAAWLTEWERTYSQPMRDKLINSMKTIGAMPKGFFTSGATYDPDTGRFTPPKEVGVGFSHLSAVFGLPEVIAELLELENVPEFEQAWLQYCRLSNLSPQERARELGASTDRPSLVEAHSRLTAYAAWKLKDKELAKRAWREFVGRPGSLDRILENWQPRRIDPPAVLNPLDEARGVSTNGTSQWGLAAMQCVALLEELLGEEMVG